MEYQQPEEQDLFEPEQPVLVPASLVKRFGNYIIDTILGAIVLNVVLLPVAHWYPSYVTKLLRNPYDFGNALSIWFFLCIYLSIQEAALGGKTIGKLLTRTRAVRTDGSRISTETAFRRSLIRIVPLEQFSILFFGRPWHDSWSGTLVVDEDLSRLP